jgi:cyclopropane fatty-acyl-phospholipid synthase-like methyltransferase
MANESDRIIELYERQATTWVKARLQEASLYEKPWLDRFCELIPPSGMVLDCGCGCGEPIARHLEQQGYGVTGVDSSSAMIRMFKARLPAQRAVIADMRSLALQEKFQGIVAWDSFFHLHHDDQKAMFTTFRNHAAPGAALMFTTGTSRGESMGKLGDEPLYHASLDLEEYRSLLTEHGFEVVSTIANDPACGGRTVWLAQSR